MTAEKIIQHLQLLPHPEGGFYKEVYRSQEFVRQAGLPSRFTGDRHFSTSIYYLLQQGDYSAFHRIKSDELWHYHAGGDLLVHVLHPDGSYRLFKVGPSLADGATFHAVVPAGCWFASEPAPDNDFTLAGCTVSPGFDFADFELAKKENLVKQFPQHSALIQRLCRQ